MNQRINTNLFFRLIVGFCVLLPISLWADAPVEEAQASSAGGYSNSMEASDPEVPLSQESSSSYAPASSSSSFNPNNPASLLAKINEMQREMQRLRGKLEVQSYELKKLKQQQQTYYNDLDQRISTLSSGKKSPILDLDSGKPAVTGDGATKATPVSAKSDTTVISGHSDSSTTEESSYNAAYELIQNKQFTEATTAMKTFIKQYPNGKYAPNAHYWLGELLLALHQDSEAVKEFDIVIHDYPKSNKVSDAMLKLGLVYAKQGNTEKARTMFINIQKMFPGTTIAQVAEKRLNSL